MLSLLEIAELMVKDRPRLESMSRKRKREYVLRQVRKIERVRGIRMSRKVGREWFVSERDVDSLRRWEPASFTEIERTLADLNEGQAAQQRQINAHGSRLRDHGGRIRALEEKEALTRKFLADLQSIDRRTTAAE